MKTKLKKSEEARERKYQRSLRTAKQQLDLLDKRPGNSTRERRRLLGKAK
jgi:hypothetical protein